MNIVRRLWVEDSSSRNSKDTPLNAAFLAYLPKERNICTYIRSYYLLEEVEDGYKLHAFTYFIEPEVEIPAFASMDIECIEFDKNFECIGGKEVFDDFFILDVKKKGVSLQLVMEFLYHKNRFCYDFIQDGKLFRDIEREPETYFKLFEYACFEPNVLEKLLKSLQIELVQKHLKRNEPIFEDKSKMHQVVGIPKKALSIMNELGISNGLENLTLIAKINVDYANMVMSYVKSVLEAGYKTRNPRSKKIKLQELGIDRIPFDDYFSNIGFLLTKGYQLNDLLKYTLKQKILYANLDRDYSTLTLPYEETRTLTHYVTMCESMNVDFEKYPTILKKAHLIYSKNYKMINNKDFSDGFKEYAKNLKKYEIENEKYCFIAPTTIEELAFEGNSLNHCLASYCKEILKDKKIVLFFRDNKKKETPFVTVELSDFRGKISVIEAAGMFNQEPEAEILEEIHLLIRKLQEA